MINQYQHEDCNKLFYLTLALPKGWATIPSAYNLNDNSLRGLRLIRVYRNYNNSITRNDYNNIVTEFSILHSYDGFCKNVDNYFNLAKLLGEIE